MTSRRGFDWDTQLAVGKRGEALLRKFEGLEPAPDGERKWDLERYEDNGDANALVTVEVKCDTYDPRKTPNFFMERHTRTPTKLLDGGPWRALAHGVDEFVYLFINGKPPEAFWFRDLGALCATLDVWAEQCRIPMRAVYNQHVRAEGYVVPRVMLEPLYELRVYDAQPRPVAPGVAAE